MTRKKGQKWFDKHSNDKVFIEVIGTRQLRIGGPLKIECFTNLEKIILKKLHLTNLEIINCSRLRNITLSELSKLKSLSVCDCPELTELTELKVDSLIELKCSNTSIKKLSFKFCPNIIKIDCSNNDKLVNLDVSNCPKLEFLDCSHNKLTILDLSNCGLLFKEYEEKSRKFNYPPGLKIIRRKNLVIVGRTGSGKSTLSNVLADTQEFEESERSFSVAKSFLKKDFECEGKFYCVIDTTGVGCTKLSTKNVLDKILDGIYSMPGGISQVLFVIDGRFTAEEAKIFNLLKDSIFEIGILEYTTIVKTKFSNFKDKNECDADKEQLHNGNEKIAEIVRSCRDVVYVDNPPIKIHIEDDDDRNIVENNKKIRQRSREKLLSYLNVECQERYFKLKSWDELHKNIAKCTENENLSKVVESNQELETFIKVSQGFCTFI
ncbi:hypothetical protein RhiirA5_424506 [Rhizophagus irregularis]|uniref:AIG1-type G domain-containing protein n=1 Tax=Rhizophagus irregularis TaxID=588596 RepID=A0A2I1E510_9GLOM|nr:hypothetical protein RhiirA5_424506 [Rhizophagus irregularis]PKC70636.1 hypothetical protein RhiirA1_454523 [Rhizophagus irregularis]PKY17223.1 hypothetical protein RhiirB3_486132 [Rhizophagus irregularis]CAB4493561.1 unnamed protein product [Rhizophagus irregularis]CAB5208602.1 unnamed protein product [Rhizophagus irregularis]